MVTFNVVSIKINGMESSSTLNIGTNILIGFTSRTKNIQGSGQINGEHGQMPVGVTLIDDRDILDNPAIE